ncbi:pantoate--beta-alanine ligase [Corynebacterium liangguodongii]|uniref:pantoate--beta-alanine ligase (AMP-forming) n=1 Tax=Corynebacterium liangguodongii TaxID=2079535 RepID=A0A2S0WFV4_9CORY|nr:pantoate--beta-alanine ligase [Corynebacterium liangguodongii]AWB84658.1 pantoate--beta-alanine ligase [Corynebacterium liangguodongii]PWB99666.1 pantoate--beta-alanine ligase [Corynebacterium liangguodongii]
MAFEPGRAVVVSDPAQLATYGRAFRKVGKPVVVVPLGTGIHAGHVELIRAARSLLGAVVMVTYAGEEVPEVFAAEKVDVVFHGDLGGARVSCGLDHLEDPDEIASGVGAVLAAVGATHATDLVLGEKDFELLVAVQRAVTALRMEVKLHSVPTVRAADGLALSLRNERVGNREAALALSAALTAGSYVAERGAAEVLATARGVLAAAGVEPDYLELRSLGFEEAPSRGDARLLAAITLGGVRLVDNVGLPLGVGFKNLEG